MPERAYDVGGFFKTSPELERPDAQILIAPFSLAPYQQGKAAEVEREPGIQANGYLLRSDSEGSVTITSSDPEAPLDIDPRFLTTPHDRQKGAALFRTMRRLFSESPIADYLVAETRPGVEVVTDQAIFDAALDEGYCGYHAVVTCAMGPACWRGAPQDIRLLDTPFTAWRAVGPQCLRLRTPRQGDRLTGVQAQASPRQRIDRGRRHQADGCDRRTPVWPQSSDRDVGNECESCALGQRGSPARIIATTSGSTANGAGLETRVGHRSRPDDRLLRGGQIERREPEARIQDLRDVFRGVLEQAQTILTQ